MVAPYAAAEAVMLLQPPLPYHPNRDPEPRHPLPFFCEGLKGCILSGLFVAGVITAVWTFSHPALPAMRVASASLSAVSIADGNSVSGECNVSLVLTNPNRGLTASYDRMEISLLYESQQVKLSQFHHQPIVQPGRSQIALEANLSFTGVSLGSDVASSMKHELERGSLGLAIEVFAEMEYSNVDQKRGSTRYMRAHCGGAMFEISPSDGARVFLNPYQECEVRVSRDIVT
ncbi:hypothetical protein AAHA92_01747 [Salvia divinorum]|uniref:Late embryogenesis abundant protein LEA-2 subgroup domain-containing protein n=1 Tax=Salvia divinorum TaxID=28513 RepID=A0ABD1IBK9_SALDI